ncbi:hypothetical protein GCM10010915_06240 [Microbacterium faecale]|uniref:Uncharacterized protein n=2 Tax=Microbacterium faecale TaxID=1804630 RepID=A0A917DDT6_9MICO|nr:hypothetical protein GCM10010915_06240 [Microbacterium faecale]
MPIDDLLIGLAGIADLADVKRQVVTTWRRRFGHESSDPFPEPARRRGEQDLFDARAVARWLVETNHGNNPHAISDAPAFAVLHHLEAADRDAVDELLALIALAGITGNDLPEHADALRQAAHVVDPHDTFLGTEIARHTARGMQPPPHLSDIVDGFYAPDLAIARIERAVSRRDRHAGSAGPLSEAIISLLADLTVALRRERGADIVLDDSAEVALAAAIRDRDEDAALDGSDSRAIMRYLAASHHAIPEISLAPVVSLTRLTGDAVDVAGALQDIAQSGSELTPDDVRIIVGPAGALVDPLNGEAERTRDRLLRSGTLRAVARLPRGHVLSAVQQPLALWILTAPAPNAAGRRIITADVADRNLTEGTVELLVNDLLAAVWPAGVSRAFALASPVPARAIIAQRASLIADPAVRHMPQLARTRRAHPLAALQHEWGRGPTLDEPPFDSSCVTAAAEPRHLPSHDLGAMVDDRHARVIPGTRLAVNANDPSGIEVLDIAAIRTDTISRRVDAMRFATEHPNAQLSRAGDVIFVTTPRPVALVDRVGSRVVAYPARILRIDATDSAGLVPRVAAEDISRADGSDWRSWRMRRVLAAQQRPLLEVLSRIDLARDELRRRLALADEIATQLTDAIAEGTSEISLPAAASTAAPQPKESA